MSLIVIIISVLFILFPKIGMLAIVYFRDEKDAIIFHSTRRFIFFHVVMVFYKTSPLGVLTFAYAFSKALNTKKLKFKIDSLIFFMALLFSGTSANILSAILNRLH